MFAINQHGADAAELSAFANVICAPSTFATLLCVDAGGTPFSRIWCLHELDHTLRGGSDKLQLLSPGVMAQRSCHVIPWHGMA